MCWSRHACAFFLFFLFVTFYGSLKLTESSRFDVVPHEYGDERSPVDPSLAPRRLSFIRRPVIVAERRRARVSFERSHAIAVLHPSRVTTRHANASRRAVPFTTRYLATVVFPVLEKKVSRGKCRSIGHRWHAVARVSRFHESNRRAVSNHEQIRQSILDEPRFARNFTGMPIRRNYFSFSLKIVRHVREIL